MALTPEKVETHDPIHLVEMAQWIGRQHPRWDNHFINQQMDLTGMGWTGINGEKTLADATQDVADVAPLSAEAAAAQATAMAGYTSIMTMRGLAQTALEGARGTGYQVDSSFGVKDTLPPNPATAQARQAGAEAHAKNIAYHVSNFQAEQQAVAQALRTHGQVLKGHTSMVDFKTDKGPAPDPHLISPDPSFKDSKKHQCDFGERFQGFADVAGGALTTAGGGILVAAGGSTEAITGGASSPVSIPGILGGLGMIATGAGVTERGLDKLHDCE